MVVYETVQEESNLVIQVEANLKTGKFEIPKANVTKTTKISNFRGIKNLECSSVICGDTQKGKVTRTSGLAYSVPVGKHGQLQIGGRVSRAYGVDSSIDSITVPIMFKGTNGNSLGMEVSLTADIREIKKIGLTLVSIINIPEVDGQLVIKYNILTQAFVVQYRSKLPGGRKDDDTTDCCSVEIVLDLHRGLIDPRTHEYENTSCYKEDVTALAYDSSVLGNIGKTVTNGIVNTANAIGDGFIAFFRVINPVGNDESRHVVYN